ncbi:MAG: 4-hydroxythreonine-4-phosphate dehydrogenase PdxA [Pseudomonadota bacterium]|nr:4-hydroxythreonine-4-phosphate dehydrogenase PdxA [Pseudomonadota bacterium]
MSELYAVTSGDPAGIGPDNSLKIALRDDSHQFVVLGNIELLRERAVMHAMDVKFIEFDESVLGSQIQKNTLLVKDFNLNHAVQPGVMDSENGSYVLSLIDYAVKGCLDGRFSGCITGPVNKEAIINSGYVFTGHTEYIGQLCNQSPVMSFVSDQMRIALLTTHLPFKDVSAHITSELIIDVVSIIHSDLMNYFGIQNPKIGITGLNPHAGENGHIGKEEEEIFLPALSALNESGIDINGPFAADTILLSNNGYDLILSIFHDQLLPLFKYANPHLSTNVTMGLKIIRTSVDHGVAYDKVGMSDINHQSLYHALDTAKSMANSYEKTKSTQI